MEIKLIKRENEAILQLKGRFDFNSHRNFRDAYKPLLENKDISIIRINLEDVLYLDSSAMGMLLLLNEHAVVARKKVVIRCGTNATVSKLLSAVSFERFFDIS